MVPFSRLYPLTRPSSLVGVGNHAEEIVERIMETKGHIAAAIDAGRETYQREKLKTRVQIN